MHYVSISTYQFIPCYTQTHTPILKPFEDSKPTGLKVDIAINSEHEPLPDAGKVPVLHSLTSVVFGESACYYSTLLAL